MNFVWAIHFYSIQCCSVIKSCLTLCDPWAVAYRASCPSLTPWAYSCPSSQWCHPTISSSVIPFFSHLQSFPISRSFLENQLFASGGQSIRVSKFAQIHVHWVDDTIQPPHSLSFPSPSALNLSQHQSFPMSHLFKSLLSYYSLKGSIIFKKDLKVM